MSVIPSCETTLKGGSAAPIPPWAVAKRTIPNTFFPCDPPSNSSTIANGTQCFATWTASPIKTCPLTASWTCVWRGSPDRKSTRLNSSHSSLSYAVFCLKKKKKKNDQKQPRKQEQIRKKKRGSDKEK